MFARGMPDKFIVPGPILRRFNLYLNPALNLNPVSCGLK
jgi:hypothetical protein